MGPLSISNLKMIGAVDLAIGPPFCHKRLLFLPREHLGLWECCILPDGVWDEASGKQLWCILCLQECLLFFAGAKRSAGLVFINGTRIAQYGIGPSRF